MNKRKAKTPYKLQGMRLHECRMKKGVTQDEARKACFMSLPAYKQYECGVRKISKSALPILADYYGVYPEYLTGEIDYGTPVERILEEYKNGDGPLQNELIRKLRRDTGSLPSSAKDREYLHKCMNAINSFIEEYKKGQ